MYVNDKQSAIDYFITWRRLIKRKSETVSKQGFIPLDQCNTERKENVFRSLL